jgi:hypothetical protein
MKICSSQLCFHGLASGKSIHKISDRLWSTDRSWLCLIRSEKLMCAFSDQRHIFRYLLTYQNAILELWSMNLRTLSYHFT